MTLRPRTSTITFISSFILFPARCPTPHHHCVLMNCCWVRSPSSSSTVRYCNREDLRLIHMQTRARDGSKEGVREGGKGGGCGWLTGCGVALGRPCSYQLVFGEKQMIESSWEVTRRSLAVISIVTTRTLPTELPSFFLCVKLIRVDRQWREVLNPHLPEPVFLEGLPAASWQDVSVVA